MKTIASIFVAACFSVSLFAIGPADRDLAIPETGFSSFEEMKMWSETSTGFGGWSERLSVSEEEVHWSTRSFTSGRATTEIVFWGMTGARVVPRLILPMRSGEYKVVPKASSVIVQRYENKRGFVNVMTIDVALFSDAYAYGKPRGKVSEEAEPVRMRRRGE